MVKEEGVRGKYRKRVSEQGIGGGCKMGSVGKGYWAMASLTLKKPGNTPSWRLHKPS